MPIFTFFFSCAGIMVHLVKFCWDVEQGRGGEIQTRRHRCGLSFGFRPGRDTGPGP